jgi:hypothetical protein
MPTAVRSTCAENLREDDAAEMEGLGSGSAAGLHRAAPAVRVLRLEFGGPPIAIWVRRRAGHGSAPALPLAPTNGARRCCRWCGKSAVLCYRT